MTIETMKKVDKAKKILDDWKKAKAVHPKPGEVEQIITNKITKLVQIQRDYRYTYLYLKKSESRLFINRKRISDYDLNNVAFVDWINDNNSVSELPIDHAKTVYNLEHAHFKDITWTEFNYLDKALKNVGFNDDQLHNILVTGKYIKDEKKLSKMEDKVHKDEVDKKENNKNKKSKKKE